MNKFLKTLGIFTLSLLITSACTNSQSKNEKPVAVSFKDKKVGKDFNDSSLVNGTTHLSVYSSIYSQTEHRTHDLTATISMRNLNLRDSIYLSSANYYNTQGKLVKCYFDYSVGMAPLETLEIVISEKDEQGGTGGNFVFDWYSSENAPHFEAVMISTSGQQGVSFRTEGINLK